MKVWTSRESNKIASKEPKDGRIGYWNYVNALVVPITFSSMLIYEICY